MIRLLVLGMVFTLWTLAVAAPTNNTAQHKGIVFPKKVKIDATEKTEDPKTDPKDHTTVSPSTVSSTEYTSEIYSSTPDVPPTVDEEYVKAESGVSAEQEDMPSEEKESDSDEDSPDEPEDGSEIIPGSPLPSDANDGLIEYNLGNPLALRLHLPWWPLKDMLRSIQDAISVMNLTMNGEIVEADNTKTKIVQFDDRNYTLKVRVFKPHENNRLLVRLISLTPVIEEGKIPTEKELKVENEQKNEALEESETNSFSQMKKLDGEKKGEEERKKGDDGDDDMKHEKKKGDDEKHEMRKGDDYDKKNEKKKDDDNKHDKKKGDDDDDDNKEEKKKAKDSKKGKQNKKKKEEKKGSDSEEQAD